MARIAINGLGRIGRAAMKIILESPDLELVAANDIAPIDNIAYLIKYDTVYRHYDRDVNYEGNTITVGGDSFKYLSEKDPASLPWGEMNVDIVIESTGLFTKREDASKHLDAGADYVIISAPSKSDDVPTVVHGVNTPDGDKRVISCASCTTNNITPVMEILDRHIGVKKALMTTIHAYTSSQQIVDAPSKKIRRGRAGAENFVPTSTGAAIATTKALPQLSGKFDGVAVRGPVPAGSIADITVVTARPTSVEEVNNIFRQEAQSERYQGIMGVTDEELVSSDIIQDSRASIIDADMTQVVDGDLVKIMTWYDNEWGYASQMIREAVRLANSMKQTV